MKTSPMRCPLTGAPGLGQVITNTGVGGGGEGSAEKIHMLIGQKYSRSFSAAKPVQD